MTTTIAPHVSTATTTTVAGPAPISSATTWVNVADGLWTGSRDGEFFGTIEFVRGGFETSDHRGTHLGRSHSLAGAKRLLDDSRDAEPEQVLLWSDERTVLALGWLAFGVAAIAAVSIATQFFV